MSSLRIQVYLSKEQRRRLDERRRRERRSIAELVREALDDYLDDPASDRVYALESTFGASPGLNVSRD